MTMRKLSAAVLALLAVLAAAWYFLAGTAASSGEPTASDLSSLATLKEEFNQAAGRPRLIVLLSPT